AAGLLLEVAEPKTQHPELALGIRGAGHELRLSYRETRPEPARLARAQALLGDLPVADAQAILVGAPADPRLVGGAARAADRIMARGPPAPLRPGGVLRAWRARAARRAPAR